MMQRFRGEIDGFYVGEPDASGFGRASAKAKHFRLRIYRAVVRRVQLLEAPPPATEGAPLPEPVTPPGAFLQDSLTDARLSRVASRGGWLEGPIHDLCVEGFRSTHQKHERGRVYGRFVGNVTACFALPPPPLPPRAEALLAELSAPEPEGSTATATDSATGAKVDAAPSAELEASAATSDRENDLDAPALADAKSIKTSPPSQVPLLLLVAAFAIAIFALCGVKRSVIWLVFLLPTLLVRRILRGALDVSTGTRAFGAVSMLAQVACLGFLAINWWASGCKDLAFLPVAGLVLGVFVTAPLPSNSPLLVNGAALGLVLTTWCSAIGKRCEEPKPPAGVENRPSAHDPGVPRTNPDGSWPRHPPRALTAPADEKKP